MLLVRVFASIIQNIDARSLILSIRRISVGNLQKKRRGSMKLVSRDLLKCKQGLFKKLPDFRLILK